MRLLCRVLTGLVLALAAPAALAAEYNETFDAGKDPAQIMGGTLLIGDDGTWHGALEDGVYSLNNASKPGAVRYYHFGFASQAEGSAAQKTELAVDVDARFEGQVSGAGLLYRFDREAKTYLAFLVMKEGGYSLFQRTSEGFRRVASGSNAAIKPEGVNRLVARLQGDQVELFINDVRILAHSAGETAGRRAGIIALDQGAYRFDNFRLSVE